MYEACYFISLLLENLRIKLLNPKQAGVGPLAPPLVFFCPKTLIFDRHDHPTGRDDKVFIFLKQSFRYENDDEKSKTKNKIGL